MKKKEQVNFDVELSWVCDCGKIDCPIKQGVRDLLEVNSRERYDAGYKAGIEEGEKNHYGIGVQDLKLEAARKVASYWEMKYRTAIDKALHKFMGKSLKKYFKGFVGKDKLLHIEEQMPLQSW